jgi:hypothetical protein
MADMEGPDTRQRQIEQRLAAATPGPWDVSIDRYDPVIVQQGSNWPRGDDDALATAYGLDDANFIANAPSDLRWLLDRVAVLEAENESYLEALHKTAPNMAKAYAAFDEATGRVLGIYPPYAPPTYAHWWDRPFWRGFRRVMPLPMAALQLVFIAYALWVVFR